MPGDVRYRRLDRQHVSLLLHRRHPRLNLWPRDLRDFLMKWLRKRLSSWKLRAAAQRKEELLALEQNRRAEAHGFWLINALLNRKAVCKRCFSIYIPKEHEFAERFLVRSILRVPDSEPDPMLCDFCFESIQHETNRQWTNIGTSNAGPPNLVLRRSIEKT